jgi:hypothetical protein
MKLSNTNGRSRNHLGLLVLAVLLFPALSFAQMNYSNWVYRNSTDTTLARCWNDSASAIMFPPGSISGMMMNMPDSIYCRIDKMPMDSLSISHDSTFIGWYRIQIGKDSTDFNMMSYSMMGGSNMMQFYKSMSCYLYWDSMMTDSVYRNWHPTGVMGWNGSSWTAMSGVTFSGSRAMFTTPEAYSAFAFVGQAPKTSSGQYSYGNWVRKNASDTTVIKCWNDSATTMMFAPGIMSGMMMNISDSIYCRVDEMPMDSLGLSHDSTFIGWYRIQIGKDTMDFNFMSFSGMGSANMMQFGKNIVCHLHWDSVTADSMYRHFHPTGIMAWNGSGWISLSDVSISGNVLSFATSDAYSAVAFVGAPEKTTAVVSHPGTPSTFSLSQNYPNPFNPTTVISYQLPAVSHVTLKVYDIRGNEIATLANGTQAAGIHTVQFSGSDLASGAYFYRLSTQEFVRTMKMLELK